VTSKTTKRMTGVSIRDNLAIAAGFGADHLASFQSILAEWLEDRFPVIARQGYALHVITRIGEQRVIRVHHAGEPVDQFNMAERKLMCSFGVYGAFLLRNLTFFDLNTGCAASGLGSDGEAPDDTPGVEFLPELVANAERSRFTDLVEVSRLRGRFQLIYRQPGTRELLVVARPGGTGLLEPYPGQDDVRKRVHGRNLKVATNCATTYGSYLRSYIARVEAIDPDPKLAAAAGLPHPEIQLRDLGPPESLPEFPPPPGVQPGELRELAEAQQASAISAWRTITSKLDQIWGIRSAGSAWVTCDFELKPSLDMDTPLGKFGVSGKLKYNFEADERGEVTLAKSERSVDVLLGFTSVSLDQDGKKKQKYKVKAAIKDPNDPKKDAYSKEVEFDPEGTGSICLKLAGGEATVSFEKGEIVSGFKLKIGGYGVEFNQNGKVDVELPLLSFDSNGGVTNISAGILTASSDPDARTFGMGLEVGLKDWFLKRFTEKGQEVPAWAKRLPDLKISLGPHFQSARDSDVLRVIAKTPGLWQLRARSEFLTLGWDSLDADEQQVLATLGFDKRKWDFKYLPATTLGLYADLTADQMMATLHLPIPSADPYWKTYWNELAASGPDLGTAIVTVQGADGSKKAGVTVKLFENESAHQYLGTTGQHGEAIFQDIGTGSYQAVAGNESDSGSTSSKRQNMAVARGTDTEAVITLA